MFVVSVVTIINTLLIMCIHMVSMMSYLVVLVISSWGFLVNQRCNSKGFLGHFDFLLFLYSVSRIFFFSCYDPVFFVSLHFQEKEKREFRGFLFLSHLSKSSEHVHYSSSHGYLFRAPSEAQHFLQVFLFLKKPYYLLETLQVFLNRINSVFCNKT